MTLPRSVELCWQKDVIEQWLNTSGVPADAHAQLLEMLRDLKAEMDISAPAHLMFPNLESALQLQDKRHPGLFKRQILAFSAHEEGIWDLSLVLWLD